MPTFNVEDGTGETDSNSYASVAEADDYLEVRPDLDDAWGLAINADKEAWLMWATQLLDQRCNFQGTKTVEESALRWPRSFVYDRDGLLVPDDEVPAQIKAATIEVAYNLAVQAVDPSNPSTGGSSGTIQKLKAAVVEITYASGSGTSSRSVALPLGLNDILSPLGSIAPVTGGGFGRILRT